MLSDSFWLVAIRNCPGKHLDCLHPLWECPGGLHSVSCIIGILFESFQERSVAGLALPVCWEYSAVLLNWDGGIRSQCSKAKSWSWIQIKQDGVVPDSEAGLQDSRKVCVLNLAAFPPCRTVCELAARNSSHLQSAKTLGSYLIGFPASEDSRMDSHILFDGRDLIKTSVKLSIWRFCTVQLFL